MAMAGAIHHFLEPNNNSPCTVTSAEQIHPGQFASKISLEKKVYRVYLPETTTVTNLDPNLALDDNLQIFGFWFWKSAARIVSWALRKCVSMWRKNWTVPFLVSSAIRSVNIQPTCRRYKNGSVIVSTKGTNFLNHAGCPKIFCRVCVATVEEL